MFSFLFIPDVRANIAPIRQTNDIFVKLIATLFVMNGLFPRDHPALAPDSPVRLTITQILETAYRNLKFTRQTLPQTLFFFGVVGTMGVVLLGALITFMALFIGHAHAQVQFFTAPGGNGAGSTDLAQQFIQYLFQGTPINGIMDENGNSILSSTVIQCGLYTALGFYSDAILIVAAMILFYHLSWMVVETAHHGQVMGQRGNQVWAPIRLVFAVGLLVPIGGNPPGNCQGGVGTGLNSGQILVIAVAQWGSGMASQVWNIFIQQLSGDQFQYVQPPLPSVRKLVTDMVNMYACMTAFNYYIDPPTGLSSLPGFNGIQADADIEDPQGIQNPAAPNASPWQVVDPNGNTKYTFANTYSSDLKLCGSYMIPQAPLVADSSFVGAGQAYTDPYTQGVLTAIYQAHNAVFTGQLATFQQTGNQDIQYFIPGNANYLQYPNADHIDPIVQAYQTAVQAAMAGLVGQDGTMQNAAATFTAGGWITAGAWFNRIARVQNDIFAAGSDGLPRSTPPALLATSNLNQFFASAGQTQVADAAQMDDIYTETRGAVIAMNAWYNVYASNPNQAMPGNPTLQDEMENSAQGYGNMTDVESDQPVDWLFMLVDKIAAANGVWYPIPQGGAQASPLGIQFTGANPLSQIAGYGFANLNAAYQMFDVGILATGIGSAADNFNGKVGDDQTSATYLQAIGVLGKAAQAVGQLLMSVGGVFFILGFMMAFFVPLIPFISFLFGSITWVMAMLEAVIAVPVVALAHLNPEGDGLPGNTGKAAYFFLFQVFLRPTLMVFGLLCAILIFYIAVCILNALFAVAVAGTGGLSHGHTTFARMVYTAIYVLLCIICANHSFALINVLPDTCMNWIGASGRSLPTENVGSLEGRMQAVQAIATQQGVGALQTGSQGAGALAGGGARVLKNLIPGGSKSVGPTH